MPSNIDVAEILLIVLIIGGILSNGGLIVLFLASRKIRKVVSIFMISLVVADLTFTALVMTFLIAQLDSDSWQRGLLGCELQTFFYILTASASILSSCCLTAERYIKITFPMRYSAIKNPKRVSMATAVLWLYSIGSSSFVFADSSDSLSALINGICSDSFSVKLFLSLFVLNYCIPVCAIFIIYTHIWKISRRHRRQISSTEKAANFSSSANGIASARRAKHTSIIYILLCVFIVCWIPVSTFTLFLKTRYDSEVAWPKWANQLYPFLHAVAFSNTVINPLIYAYSNKHFKSGIKEYILRRSLRVNSLPTRSSNAFTMGNAQSQQERARCTSTLTH